MTHRWPLLMVTAVPKIQATDKESHHSPRPGASAPPRHSSVALLKRIDLLQKSKMLIQIQGKGERLKGKMELSPFPFPPSPTSARSLMGITLLLGALSLAGCRSNLVSPPTPEKLQVVVSIAPQQYFVERIGNGYVKVNVLVPPGSEPHTFEMKPEQLKAIAQAQVYFRIRIDFEKAWLDKIQGANPKMRIVDTTQGIQLLPVETRSPEKSTEHLDPHIWLSPKLVKIQAQTIYGALATLDPKHQAAYQANLKRFLADLDALDAEIRQSLKGVKNAKIVVYHPSWGYFARDYGLQQIPIEVGGQEPSAAELAAIMEEAKQAGVKVIFTEPQFSQQSAQTIAREIGAEVMPVDPLSPDWLNNLRNIVKTFNKTLQQQQALAVH